MLKKTNISDTCKEGIFTHKSYNSISNNKNRMDKIKLPCHGTLPMEHQLSPHLHNGKPKHSSFFHGDS